MLVTEDSKEHDKHTIVMMKDGDIVGHVPHSLSMVSWFFFEHSRRMTCRIIGKRKFGNPASIKHSAQLTLATKQGPTFIQKRPLFMEIRYMITNNPRIVQDNFR